MGVTVADYTERIIRFVDLTPDESERFPVGHFEGDDVIVECPDWLAITQEDSQPEGDRFWLYWLYTDGRVIDFSIKRSLEAVAVPGLAWQTCDVVVPETDEDWPSRLVSRSAIV
jgi:hypothetical protein